MTEFKAGDKVRINEGLLEGQVGTVVKWGEHVTLVALEDTAFGGGSLTFYTEALVSADEPHEALSLAKLYLYPDRLKGGHWFRTTIWVGDIQYISNTQMEAALLLRILSKPPAGLCAVECIEKATASKGDWKAIWIE